MMSPDTDPDQARVWCAPPAPLNPTQRLLVVGIYINGALYLACCFIAGILIVDQIAWKAALAGMGFSYLGYTAQVMGCNRAVNAALVALSVGAGVFSGVSLLPW